MTPKRAKKAGRSSQKTPAVREVPVRRQAEPGLSVRAGRPLWPLSAWEQTMDRWFEDVGGRLISPWRHTRPRWPAERVEFAPVLDVYEHGDEIVVKAELPGLSKDDVEVSLSNSTLTVKGQKKQEEEIKREDYYRYERSFGAFSRRIELPAAVKADEATATFKDGVLEVRLRKTDDSKRRVVTVQVG